jgi:hypothetical protein
VHALAGAARADLIAGVHTVFVVGSAIAALALLVVLALPEVELRGAPGSAGPPRPGPDALQTRVAAN